MSYTGKHDLAELKHPAIEAQRHRALETRNFLQRLTINLVAC